MAAKVSLSFGKLADTQLDNFAQAVIDGITGNAAFPTPPITLANLQTAQADFARARLGSRSHFAFRK